MPTAEQQVAALLHDAKRGARIELRRRENADNNFTCHTIEIYGGCGDKCPVFLAHDCEHGKPENDE